MKDMVKKVRLLKPFDVDRITVSRDSYFPNAYMVDLPLDSAPGHVWQDLFESKWRASRHLWDRKLFLMSDKLRLVTPPDDFVEKLDWIEQVIDETNKEVDKYNEGAETGVVDQRELWEEKARIEMFRDILRKRFA